MQRPAITLVFLGLSSLLVTEGFVVFRFLSNAADATKLVAVERQLAHEASGITRKVMAQAKAHQERVRYQQAQAELDSPDWVTLQNEGTEGPSPGVATPVFRAQTR